MKQSIFSVILDMKIKNIGITFCNFLVNLTYDNMQVVAPFGPHLFSGSEEELVNLLKDNNNDMIKEGVLNVLAKAGGTIREQLAVSSRCHCKIY